MKDYVILTDSCCDLSAGMAEELELEVLPLSFLMEGKEYFNHLDYRDIAAKDFTAVSAAALWAPPPPSTWRYLPRP